MHLLAVFEDTSMADKDLSKEVFFYCKNKNCGCLLQTGIVLGKFKYYPVIYSLNVHTLILIYYVAIRQIYYSLLAK